jgi:hypothetical protein
VKKSHIRHFLENHKAHKEHKEDRFFFVIFVVFVVPPFPNLGDFFTGPLVLAVRYLPLPLT